jgi:pimeloyl-ACP methyl ester carboxylesterase
MPLELAYRQEGNGPALVVLHGLFGSSRNWASIAKFLAARHRVFSVDLRNHGESPWSDEMTYAAMADDIAALLHRLGIEKPMLLGHSMGGKVAMALALTQPQRVAALAVVDIAPVTYGNELEAYARAMLAVDLARTVRRAEVEARLAESIPDPGVRAFLLQNLVRGEDSFAWRLNLPVLSGAMDKLRDFPAALHDATYGGLTWFIAGALSDYVRPEHEPHIRALFPAAEIRPVACAGHWVHAETPQAFIQTLDIFLARASTTID